MFVQAQNVRVQKTSNRGKGVFARRVLQPGTVVADYLGQIYDLRSVLPRYPGLYDMWIYKNLTICPDISGDGAHLINHSCEPNCVMYPYRGHILIVTTRMISAGEELTFHYWCSEDSETARCRCGTKTCQGTWHVSEDACDRYCRWVEQRVASFYKHRSRVGDQLKPFMNYPKRTSMKGLRTAVRFQTLTD